MREKDTHSTYNRVNRHAANLHHLFADAKVADLDGAIEADEYVGGLDVCGP
jgi:hypothetical protein